MDSLITVPGILSLAELVVNIKDRFGHINPKLMVIKEKDIKEPVSEFVVSLYVEYLRYLKINTSVSTEDFKKFENPEAYKDTLPMMKIFTPLRTFFQRQNATDFSMLDLLSPTYKRTYGGIAVMDNYVSFCQMAMEDIYPKINSIEEKKLQMQELCEKKDNLLQESNRKDFARSQRAGKLAEMDKFLSAKKSSCAKLTSTIDEMNSQANELTSKLQTEKLKTNSLKEGVNQLEEELNSQKILVIMDPEQIERKDLSKKESLKEMNNEVQNYEKEIEMLSKKVQTFEQMMEIKSKMEKHMENARKLKQYLDEKESQISNKEETLETLGIESKSKQDEYIKKKAIVNKLKETITTEKAKADSRLAVMEKTVQQLKLELANVGEKMNSENAVREKLAPIIKEQKDEAQYWIDTKNKCEEFVNKKKNDLDEMVKKEMVKVDITLNKVLATAQALKAKAAQELADAEKLD